MNILIAEDDPVSALVLRKTLEKMGHEVTHAEDGFQAWKLFQQNADQFPLVISDWMMPTVDGLGLTREIRNHGGDIYVFVILLTARAQRDDRLTALEAGVDDFLAKPLDRAELAARLRVAERLIAWQQTLQEVNTSLLTSSRVLAEQTAELDRMHQQAEYLANHDHLTGTTNRRRWFEIAAHERPTAVAIYDLDHFKRVNDTHGHPVGDAVLVECASRLKQSVGNAGWLGRVGGEEFAVLWGCDWPTAQVAAARVIEDVAASPFRLPDGETLTVTVSGGLSPWLPDGESREASIARTYEAADAALYEAKAAGRNRLNHTRLRAA